MRGLIPVVLAMTLFAAGLAAAAECPGNPGALGISRTVVVDPVEHPRLGVMQYGESLPLEDHEVVLTFDDGPLPPRTNHILDILASECVKATFFMVGRMAMTYPDVARRVEAAGHTVDLIAMFDSWAPGTAAVRDAARTSDGELLAEHARAIDDVSDLRAQDAPLAGELAALAQ